nr:MAG TPA: hypothetical protein [Caudoviricetes sp.]
MYVTTHYLINYLYLQHNTQSVLLPKTVFKRINTLADILVIRVRKI